MSVSNRSSLINKTFKVLKRQYDPILPPSDRTILEHLLYACCLENATPEAADEAYARLQQVFFDWNEIRVTTVVELAETMSSVPDAADAATRLKRVLQHVFEARYAYDIEALRKQNIGKAAKEVASIRGVTPYGVAYVTQHGLGGHSIPVSEGILGVLQVIGIISDAEARKKRVPGLERAIPKSKGIEFASLLHQLGAEFYVSPHSPKLHAIILEIAPDAKDRLPKQTSKGGVPKAKAGRQEEAASERKSGKRKSAAAKKQMKKSAKSETAAKKKGDREKAAKSKTPAKRSPTKQLTRKKPR